MFRSYMTGMLVLTAALWLTSCTNRPAPSPSACPPTLRMCVPDEGYGSRWTTGEIEQCVNQNDVVACCRDASKCPKP